MRKHAAALKPGVILRGPVFKDGRALWVMVKGYPAATVKTSATMQASHWFEDVFFLHVVG